MPAPLHRVPLQPTNRPDSRSAKQETPVLSLLTSNKWNKRDHNAGSPSCGTMNNGAQGDDVDTPALVSGTRRHCHPGHRLGRLWLRRRSGKGLTNRVSHLARPDSIHGYRNGAGERRAAYGCSCSKTPTHRDLRARKTQPPTHHRRQQLCIRPEP